MAIDLGKYSDDQPRDYHGRWTADGASDPTVPADATGFTFHPYSAAEPQTGYQVALRGRTTTIDAGVLANPPALQAALRDFANANHDILTPGGHVDIGGWVHDGKLYLQPSEHVETRRDAVRLGRERDQFSVWDDANRAEIPTGGQGIAAAATADLLKLREILKYSDDQPRDENGRWTGGASIPDAPQFQDPAVAQRYRDEVARIKDLDHEENVMFTADGRVLAAVGDGISAPFTPEMRAAVKDAWVLHNHPAPLPLSSVDLNTMLMEGTRGIDAVVDGDWLKREGRLGTATPEGLTTFRATPGSTPLPDLADIRAGGNYLSTAIRDAYQNGASKNGDEVWHLQGAELTDRLGRLGYDGYATALADLVNAGYIDYQVLHA